MESEKKEEVPSYLDLQVLSPMAWIHHEAGRVARDEKTTPRERLSILEHRLDQAAGTFLNPEQYGSDEERRRHLEYRLIQLASEVVLWLKEARRDPIPLPLTSED